MTESETAKETTDIVKEFWATAEARFPVSDFALLKKIADLPFDRFIELPNLDPRIRYPVGYWISSYRKIIKDDFFSSIVSGLQQDKKNDFSKLLKLESLNIALRNLWVIEAQKGRTFRFFKNYQDFEDMLFQSNPYYRGHYVHQFDVFLLGYFILNKILDIEDKSAHKQISEKFLFSKNPNFTWMLSSTFHDMGYPIEQMDQWMSEFLKKFMNVEMKYFDDIKKILTPIFFDYLNYLCDGEYSLRPEERARLQYSTVRDWKFYNILLTKLRNKDHGIISALLLMHSLFTEENSYDFRQWFNRTFPSDIWPACHAIAVHNLENDGFQVNLAQHPYAFLLILCDTIQDWERSINGKDYSELKQIEVSLVEGVITIECLLKINNLERKHKELDKLQNRLKTNGLLKVIIKQEDSDRIWKL